MKRKKKIYHYKHYLGGVLMKLKFTVTTIVAICMAMVLSVMIVTAYEGSKINENEKSLISPINEELMDAFTLLNYYHDLTEEERGFVEKVRDVEGIHSYRNLLVASLGEKPKTGYRMDYVKQVNEADRLVIFVEISEPEPGMEYGDALTYPKIVGKVDLSVNKTVILKDYESGDIIFEISDFISDPIAEPGLIFHPVKDNELTEFEREFLSLAVESEGIYQIGDLFIITAGMKPTTGYSWEFVDLKHQMDEIAIHLKLNEPKNEAGLAITYPYLAGRLNVPPMVDVTFYDERSGQPLFGIGSPTVIDRPIDEIIDENDYIPEQFRNVDPHKEWTITFNHRLNEESATNDTVFISERANGSPEDRFPIAVELIDEKKIKVTPLASYRAGHIYRLHITTDVTSSRGMKLREATIVAFSVAEREELPVFNENRDLQFSYDFSEGKQGWEGVFAEYHIGEYAPIEMYEMEFSHEALPTGDDQHGLYMQSMNRSDDVFMFIRKHLGFGDGLLPNTTYFVNLEFDLATNVAGGLFGVGGAPGEAVFVKAGGTTVKPEPVFNDGFYDMNIYKSNQSGGDVDAAVLGHIAKEHSDDDSWELKPFQHSFEVTTNENGEIWLLIGTDSGFEGLTTIYFTNISATLMVSDTARGQTD